MKKTLFIFFFISSLNGWTQKQLNQPDIFFEHIYLPGALHFNSINDIAQDSSGLMWFASDNGIYRYDGYELQNSNDHINFQSVKERQVWSVAAGTDQYIYASLKKNKGLIKVKNDFSQFELIKGELSSFDLHELFLFKNKIAFLSRGKGLFFIDEENETVKPFEGNYPIFSITQSEGKLYAGSYDEIFIFSNDSTNEIKIPELNNYISALCKEGNNLWIATQQQIYKYDLKSNKIEKKYSSDLFNNDNIANIFHDLTGNLWVLTDWNGIFILRSDGGVRHFEKNYYQKGSLSNNRIHSYFRDKNGIVWIGTGAGVNKYDRNKRYFSHLSHDPSNNHTLSADLVRAVFENSKEEIFIGTDDGTINIIDSARLKIQKIPIVLPGLEKVVPFSFFEDPENKDHYILGTTHGLVRLNKKNNSFKLLNSPSINGDMRVRQVIPYDSERLLCLSRGQLWFYNIKTGDYKLINAHKKDNTNTLRGGARTLYKDKEENLYIGGMGTLLNYNPMTNEIYSRKIVSVSEEGDTVNHMILFVKKYENKMYIGTFQGGLYVLDLSVPELKGTLQRFTKNHGLPDNTIYAALKDDSGFFWITTNMGISRFNPINETFYNYDRDNGLQGEEFNRLAFEETKRGEFIFGGIEGLNIFFPDKIYHSNSIVSNPVIITVDVINQFSETGTRKNPRYSLLNRDKVELQFDENYLNFKFSSSNFSQPEKNKYYYKLENYDKEWIYTNDHSATYTGLKPGNYVFHVKSISPDGSISRNQASIPLQINSRWWQSWWTGLLFGSLVFGFVAYSFRLRVQKNKAIKSFLEKEIERRTKELQESKEELARLNKKKDFIFSILSHDLRSPLTTLKGFLGILVDHFDTLNEDEIKTHAVNIKNSVAKSLDLLDNTLFWSLSQMGDITYNPGKISISILFEKIIGLYDLTAQKKDIKIVSEIEENIFIYADENMAYITLRNLVSNALKFTPSGKSIYLRVYKQASFAFIIIEDEGKGIKPEDLSKLFDQNQNFMQKGTSNEKGTGLGLILCKKFTDMNNGSISVESKEDHGSKFTVVLPLFETALIPANQDVLK